ncbi:MAG: EamA family transporter [Thermoleophilia bacterium]|jgi:inner membrane transporter RhtA
MLAPLLVVAIAFSMQSGSALATKVIGSVGVVDALWLRTGLAALILIAVRPRSLRLPPREQRATVALLALSLLGMNLSFYGAISVAPLGIVVAIEFAGPLVVAVAGSRRPIDFVWVALAAGGIAALIGPRGSIGPGGLALSLSAGLFWALYLVLGRRAVSTLEPLHVTTLMVTGSAILLTPVALLFAPRLGQHPSAVALGALVALLSSAAPYFVELVALRLVRAATYSVLLSLEPAIAALTGFVLVGQTLSGLDVTAIVAVMIAAGGASWSAASHHALAPLPPDGGAPV